MGEEIPYNEFTQEDFIEFHRQLRQETKILADWFKNDAFERTNGVCGMELEAWLVDKSCKPVPKNESFLAHLSSTRIVPELSKFNFELNTSALPLKGRVFTALHTELADTWSKCRTGTQELGIEAIAIGILPTIEDSMLNLDSISPLKRYYALNQQIFEIRKGQSMHLDIEGAERVQSYHQDVMMESAATALQTHLQINADQAVRYYNAAMIASAATVATAANSAFLFGKELWDETRIPLFEQSIDVLSFRDRRGDYVGRVTFGGGYVRHSLMEPFLDNLDSYHALLPISIKGDPAWLSHLRLHNGTIWRWNRPLIGLDERGRPHLRIEHRVTAAGPSTPDTVANVALFVGLTHSLAQQPVPPETQLSFEDAKHNFYEAAKHGLRANVRWLDGKTVPLQTLILDALLPKTRKALSSYGVDKEDISIYIDNIIEPRVRSGQNGATWQKSYAAAHGRDLQAMTQAYLENQKRDIPVHEWAI